MPRQHHRDSRWSLSLGLPLGLLLLTACAHTPLSSSQDAAEAVLALPADQVRLAARDVLTEEGYGVDELADPRTTLTTGYRREIDSPWNWLLRARFGVGRSQAEARITELSDASTKLTIQVQHDSKASFWNGWTESEPPLAQRPDYYLRLIKQRLQVL